MKFISIPVFIISLAIGFFVAYLTTPTPQIIYVYPTPDNIGKVQYKDEGGTCFGFTARKLKCPDKRELIRKYPVQDLKHKPKK